MRLGQTLIVFGGVLVGMAASTWVALRAQIQTEPKDRPPPVAQHRAVEPKAEPANAGARKSAEPEVEPSSIQQAMLRVYRLPFTRPTSLEEVRAHLKKTLNVPVVLDLAALGRQALTPDDTVRLELDGVRLKTGLQLLLDQVGLTYRVVSEDDLLILTDREGSEDPLTKIRAEIRELHRDVHTIQDSIDDLTDLLIPEGLDLKMRKPTMIEELPESQDFKGKPTPEGELPDAGVSPGPHSPGRRSGGRVKPAPPPSIPPAETPPARVPLGHPRKRA